MIEEVYHTYLDCGYSPLDFWDLTYIEIVDTIEAYARRREGEQREQAIFNYKLADLIGSAVAALLDSKNKYPKIYEAFPGMFDEELREEQEAKVAEAQTQAYKAHFMDFVINHNNKNRRKAENDTGRIESAGDSPDSSIQ